MHLSHQPGAEKGIVDFTTTFAEQAFYLPLPAQPA